MNVKVREAISNSYKSVLDTLKEKIRLARLNVTYTVNTELLRIYWEIGKTISDQEIQDGWGAKTVETLSKDLRSEFKDMKGLSPRNLRYMRDFAISYPYFPFLQAPLAKNLENDFNTSSILQAPLAKLSWYHHITLINNVKDPAVREFYIEQTIQNGWSRNVMVHQIESGLHKRKGQLPTNFKNTIDPEQSELIQQIFKDPYKLDFLSIGNEAKERDLEDAIISQITNLLLELGQWFSFLGRQYKVTLGDKEYFFDLVFYHTRLKRYIIIDLKIGEFVPEHLGKMEFYLELADEQLKDDKDNGTIGLILCKTKDGLVAEYALRDSKKPIGIAEYKIRESLPADIKGELPSIEEIEQRMEEEMNELKKPVEKKFEKLMQKLGKLKNEEAKMPGTYEILCRIIDNGLKPLFKMLIQKLGALNSNFISHSFFWAGSGKTIETYEEFEQEWKDEKLLQNHRSLNFWYRLHGLKKGGTDAFDAGVEFQFIIDPYWYGFKLLNDREPFFKKLYGQDLTKDDIEGITDFVYEKLIEDVDRRLEY